MYRTALACLALGVVASSATTASAAFIDEFADTSNLNVRGSDTNFSATASSDRLTLTRTATGFNNIDYYEDAESIGAVGFSPTSNTFDLATQGIFKVEDVQPIDPDGGQDVFLAFRAFYYDAGDNFLQEVLLIGDSYFAPGSDIEIDLATTAPINATAYNVLISFVIPGSGDPGDGYSFESISAVPEPASAVLCLTGLGLLMGRRRRLDS